MDKEKKEQTITVRKLSYAQLFKNVGVGHYLHVPIELYSKAAVQVECSRQNKYAGCNNLDNKFTTSTTIKKGYITIYQRR